MQRVILVFAAERLYGSLQLHLPADKRVVVCQAVVEAGHVVTPWFCFLLFIGGLYTACFFCQLRFFVVGNEQTEEFGQVAADCFL